MAQSSSWVEQHISPGGQQLVVHLSGDDLRVLAAGVPVTVQATQPGDRGPAEPESGPAPVDVLVRADRA